MSRIHCNDQDEQPVFSENPVSLIFYTSIAVVFFLYNALYFMQFYKGYTIVHTLILSVPRKMRYI